MDVARGQFHKMDSTNLDEKGGNRDVKHYVFLVFSLSLSVAMATAAASGRESGCAVWDF
jgi:hypothetical protein